MSEVEKRCPRCGLILVASLFHRRSGRINQLSSYCKSCMKDYTSKRQADQDVKLRRSAYSKKYRSANIDKCRKKDREYARKWRRLNPSKFLHKAAKVRAKSAGLEFDINPSDVVIPEVCPVLGMPLRINDGLVKDDSPTLDRIDSNKGYTKGNVCVISWRANRLKSDATADEAVAIANWMQSLVLARYTRTR